MAVLHVLCVSAAAFTGGVVQRQFIATTPNHSLQRLPVNKATDPARCTRHLPAAEHLLLRVVVLATIKGGTSVSEINTNGFTHLFYSFVFFDPRTFQMKPMDASDANQYREFTSLASNTLQTWCAVGGWSFSDPGDTHMAWSTMVSEQANRAAFIKSLITFMTTYGFQGADLDWEYPADAKRGGQKGDADNLVLLVKEMRAAFGSRFGLSLTLAPDYWYLRGFKPKAMEPYVDFMGFMAYDLHGPWDTDVKALGKRISSMFFHCMS
jgi:hypothetical protein